MHKYLPILVALSFIIPVAAQDAMPPPEEPTWRASDDDFLIRADDWARPRHGERVATMPTVVRAVRAWMDAPDRRLAVIYPGGEAGFLWASEVRDWLVSLGVDPDALLVRAGSPVDDAIVLRLER